MMSAEQDFQALEGQLGGEGGTGQQELRKCSRTGGTAKEEEATGNSELLSLVMTEDVWTGGSRSQA